MTNIKDLVKGNFVTFDRFRQGIFYYRLKYPTGKKVKVNLFYDLEEEMEIIENYEFQVPIEDIGDATLLEEDKAITFMRWIRKSLEDKTLVQI